MDEWDVSMGSVTSDSTPPRLGAGVIYLSFPRNFLA